MWTPTLDEAEAGAEGHGTPFYAYALPVAVGAAQGLRAATEGALGIWYAVKANPNRAILRALRPHVDGADVASEGELVQVLAEGFSGDRIGVTGPGKTAELHRAAIRAGAVISVESRDELEAVAAAAAEEGAVAQVLLRINAKERSHAFRVATSGVPGPFGIDEEELEAAVHHLLGLGPRVEGRGIHVHAGSACSSAAAWHRHAVHTLDLAARAEARGLPLRRVNLGGGLASPGDGLDVPALGRKLSGMARKFRRAFGAVELVMEPGRALVSESGCFVTRVVRRVVSRGTTVVVLDGGLNAFLFATERFHDGPAPRVVNLTRPAAAPGPVRLVGPCCTPLDRIGEGLMVADPRPGDLLAVGPAGAYGFSASPHLFLGHDVPAELAWANGRWDCIRPRRRLADFD